MKSLFVLVNSMISMKNLEEMLHNKAINSTIIATITNYGYLDFTLNLLKSLERLKLRENLLILTIDKKAYSKLNSLKIDNFYLENSDDISEFMAFRKDLWDIVMRYKIIGVYEILKRKYNVLYTDGDIVWLKNPINYLSKNGKKYDILFQSGESDYNEKKNYLSEVDLCLGFFYVKSNRKTLDLFNPNNISRNFICDQLYINDLLRKGKKKKKVITLFDYFLLKYEKSRFPFIKFLRNKLPIIEHYTSSGKVEKKLKYNILPLNLFPHGLYWNQNHNKINTKSFIIHFCFVIGYSKKIEMMKKFNIFFQKENNKIT